VASAALLLRPTDRVHFHILLTGIPTVLSSQALSPLPFPFCRSSTLLFSTLLFSPSLGRLSPPRLISANLGHPSRPFSPCTRQPQSSRSRSASWAHPRLSTTTDPLSYTLHSARSLTISHEKRRVCFWRSHAPPTASLRFALCPVVTPPATPVFACPHPERMRF
jgi:hypothetical protein